MCFWVGCQHIYVSAGFVIPNVKKSSKVSTDDRQIRGWFAESYSAASDRFTQQLTDKQIQTLCQLYLVLLTKKRVH